MIRIRVRYHGEDVEGFGDIAFFPEHGDAVELVDADDQPVLQITSVGSDSIVIDVAPRAPFRSDWHGIGAKGPLSPENEGRLN